MDNGDDHQHSALTKVLDFTIGQSRCIYCERVLHGFSNQDRESRCEEFPSQKCTAAERVGSCGLIASWLFELASAKRHKERPSVGPPPAPGMCTALTHKRNFLCGHY